ncbi:MAG TPA: putative glycoside hydrolase, partial [Phycisphaerae bacterium]|nr:putative glycoside hydrolase [Phycisphaerae bacterium]
RIVSHEAVNSVTVQTQTKTQYYWAVHSYIGDPNDPILGPIFSFYADNGYPDFSWDHVPLYAHLSIQDIEPDQYNFLADRFSVITFTGGKVKHGSLEENIAAGASAVKQRHPNAKVLFYWCGSQKRGWKQQQSYDTFPDDGYLPGERPFFDLSRQDVRDWWSDGAAKAVQDYSCDGIFVDGAPTWRPESPWSRQFGAEKAAVLDAGMVSMFKDAKKKMGSDKLIIFNALHGYDQKHPPMGERYLPVTDGAMIDDFDRAANINQQSTEYLANTLEAMRRAAQDGKIVVFKTWPGFTWWSDEEMMKKPHEEIYRVAKERITFPLACFLVAAEPNCYFCYTWGWLGEYGTFDWYSEFDKPLGPPKGEAIRKDWTYHREFAHASVFVDLEKRTAKIDWR